ncbi:nucleic acid/nucleotide deaminase domain-containing protein [Aspergillus stella-maris]|uniref:nucleic acid/nucleotide deaminase domain-containing protein n=1 Tax=Aspergillus stella-maris TaxID=1810926 RepID=UPI003CCDD9BC
MPTRKNVIEQDPGDVEAFYAIICFSRSLNIVRGNRIKPMFSAESDGVDLAKCRRDFADAIAYFCAYKSDPDCVTAVALGQRETKVILWVASNAKVPRKVVDFLESNVLNVVQRLAYAFMQEPSPPSEAERITGLLNEVLQFTSEKNFTYYKRAVTTWSRIYRSGITGENPNLDLAIFHQWFKRTFQTDGDGLAKCDMPKLSSLCYDQRKNKTFDILKHFSSQGNEHSLEYERLHKLLYKLGKHIMLFKKMIHATISLRQVFQRGFIVEPIPASTPKPIPLPKLNDRALKKIVTRIFPGDDERNQFYHHLDQFYDLNMEKIKQSLQPWEKTQVRVHAEILLIDYLDKTSGEFLDINDKYVGCSKPACYLCYRYICQHPGKYTHPPTHQKVYHAWALPIVQANDRNCSDKYARHVRFLRQIAEDLRSELRHEVRRQLAPRKFHADSTAGESSVVDISRARRSKGLDDSILALIRKISEG